MSEKNSQIKKIIEELLLAMDFAGEVKIDEQQGDFLRIDVQSPEAAYLIGRGGENLAAFQQISRALIGKKIQEPLRFVVDVNDYQLGKIEMIKEMAIRAVGEVLKNNAPQWLSPMNAYERRIVHMIVAKNEGVISESEGIGEERRIKIMPGR
jgi:spoIIIJ-associated protein